jgi:hypothetical protein
MTERDFSLCALYDALEVERRARELSWTALAAEVNRHRTHLRPIAVSTIAGLRDKSVGEGDTILQVLLWLRRSPESFVLPNIADADAARFRLPVLTTGQILRWDTRALHAAADAQRRVRAATWTDVARDVGGFSASTLTHLAKGGRTGFPHVMRLVAWLDRPAVTFTHIAAW